MELPNVFAVVTGEYSVPEDYNTKTSAIIKVDTNVIGQEIRGRYCNGELREKEFKEGTIAPFAGMGRHKYNSLPTVLSLRLAFLRAMQELMEVTHCASVSNMDVTWDVVVLLPPGDMANGKEKMIEIVRDIKEIESVYPELRFPIKTDKVIILPEGYCAYIAVVFETGKKLRESHKYMTEGMYLIMDFGGGTSDFIIMEDNKMLQNAKHTIEIGGSSIRARIKSIIKEKHDFMVSNEDLEKGIKTGFVKKGASQIDISKYIGEANRDIASRIRTQLYDWLLANDINPSVIEGVMICGGGSVDNGNYSVQTLGSCIRDEFRTFAPECNLVQLPEMVVNREDKNGELVKEKIPMNPRELNIIGAGILAEVL